MSSYNRDSNPYLKLNFWEFLALSTVMLLFFPWSILVCLALYGIDETKLIVLAVIEDFAKTLLMVIAAVATIVIEFIPDSIVDLKVAELNQEQEDRKSENIF